MVKNFKSLKIWVRAVEIAERVYFLTGKFPCEEKFGLVSQLRRAVVSISSNIAEGCGRRTNRDLINFLHISIGSLRQVQSELLVSCRLGFLEKKELDVLDLELDELARMISGYINYVRGK